MNKSPLFSVSCIALLTGLTLQPTGFGQVNIDGLVNQAFGRLAQGRSYKTNFPVAQTRRQVVSFFIGNLNDVFTDPPVMNPVDGNSSIQVTPPQNGQPKTGLLKQALDGVAAICDNAQSTPTQLAAAEEIANQAAAAMLEGYLFAGNADLLDGLRENYPAPAGGNSWKPAEQRSAAVGMPPSYAGANILKLGYATLYFQEGIKQILDYITLGCSPNLLALDGETFPDELKHFTRYNVQPPPPPGQNDPPAPPQALPHPRFRDTVGASGLDIPSQTPGALFGESLNRLAMASQGLADRLWRAAYFKSNRPPSEKQLMLDHAQKVLKSNIQGQFLASLPMAATLEDGYSMVNGAPTQNEYQAVRIDKARAAIVASQELLGKIVGGEAPKLTSLENNWKQDSINSMISATAALRTDVQAAWTAAEQAIQDRETADVLNNQDVQALQDKYYGRLKAISGLDPKVGVYAGLRTRAQRDQYRSDVHSLLDTATASRNVSATFFTQQPYRGTEMSLAALRMLQSFAEIEALQAEIASYPKLIDILDEQTGFKNTITLSQGAAFSAIEIGLGIAALMEVEICTCGLSSGAKYKLNPLDSVKHAQEAVKEMIRTTSAVLLNNNDKKAEVARLLIQQSLKSNQLPVLVAQAQGTIAELQRLGAEIDRLLEEQSLFLEGTTNLWYKDPSLVFDQEKEEEDYKIKLQDYRINLYRLSQMLKGAWNEPFSNPFFNTDRAPVNLAARFDDFSQAESVFNVLDWKKADDFFMALKEWDTALRGNGQAGVIRNMPAASPQTERISLRQDIWGYNDTLWDPGLQRFRYDEAKHQDSLRRFRARLLRAKAETDNSLLLRLNFGLEYHSTKEVEGDDGSQFNYVVNHNSQLWNQRLRRVAVKVHGRNVIPSGTNLQFNLYQHGRITRVGYFDDSSATQAKELTDINLTLYQNEPPTRSPVSQWDGRFFGLVTAATGSETINIGNLGTPSAGLPGEGVDVEWPLFCDDFYLIAEKSGGNQANRIQAQNIDDIELRLIWTFGHPPAFGGVAGWPNITN